MPSTYTLISSNVLSSSAASVTFSAIPSTFTDLVLRCSVRTDALPGDASFYTLTFNGVTSNFSYTVIRANSSTVSSIRGTSTTQIITPGLSTGNDTANTFGSVEFYIPSYTLSQNKPVSGFGMAETNASFTNANASGVTAGLWSNTAAISSVTLTESNSNTYSIGSSFYLYGLKNS